METLHIDPFFEVRWSEMSIASAKQRYFSFFLRRFDSVASFYCDQAENGERRWHMNQQPAFSKIVDSGLSYL